MSRIAPVAMLLLVLGALLGPSLIGRGATDVDLAASLLPPLSPGYPLGSDSQGRDVLAGSVSGLRTSLMVGVMAVGLALFLGLAAGLAAGLARGLPDILIMRAVDVLQAFPALLLALLLDGILRLWSGGEGAMPDAALVAGAIGVARLPPLARVARATARGVLRRDFVAASRLAAAQAGKPAWSRVAAHVLPNVIGPVVALATLDIGLAVTDEVTLSFLGIGLPPSHPSLGTLIRLGQGDLLSGLWWPVLVPGVLVVGLVVVASRCGEQLRVRFGAGP